MSMGDDQLPKGATVAPRGSEPGSASPVTLRCRAASW